MFVPNDTTSAFIEAVESAPLPVPCTVHRVEQAARGPAAKRRKTEQELRNALAHDQLVLHYQPRYDLATGAMVGAEALIRWPHKKLGLLPPADFLPTAERSALITRLGGWVLRTACAEAATWNDGVVSVNIAGRQLADGTLYDQVTEALDLSGLAPERLELDLTEAMLVDIDIEVILMLSAIRDLGVGLALDDFGTGHASLNVLRHVPLSAVKLDRSVVRELLQFRSEAAVVRGLIDIAHAMDLAVVAEGIETEAQRACLVELGCDEGQGFLFCKAVPADRLRDHRDAWPTRGLLAA
jgi:EAL domain-containing protein (putative c-di-GMP-specific phosphodiesterase class I)